MEVPSDFGSSRPPRGRAEGPGDPLELVAKFLRQLFWLQRQEVPVLELHLFNRCLGAAAAHLESIVNFVNEQAGLCLSASDHAIEVTHPIVLGRFAAKLLDPRAFANLYSWQQFEAHILSVCRGLGFHSTKNFRFTHVRTKKRWEIDVIAIRGTLVVAMDGKRWARKATVPSTLKKAALEQAKRVRDLARDAPALQRLFDEVSVEWRPGYHLVAAIVTARATPVPFTKRRVPLLSIYQIEDFLQAVPHRWEGIYHERVHVPQPPPIQATLV